MKKYLNINNPIMRGLSRVTDCLFLSVLWLVFSLPVGDVMGVARMMEEKTEEEEE